MFWKAGTFYDPFSQICVPDQQFGQKCFSTDQCQNGLMCGTVVNPTNVCLKGLNQTCGVNSDCANAAGCENGVCDCLYNNLAIYTVIFQKYIQLVEILRDLKWILNDPFSCL